MDPLIARSSGLTECDKRLPSVLEWKTTLLEFGADCSSNIPKEQSNNWDLPEDGD